MQWKEALRESFFSDGEQMGSAIRPLLAGIYLHHAGYIERVDSGKGIRRDQDDTRVSVDFLLQVPQLNGLKHCVLVSMLAQLPVSTAVSVPAGSFRCDRLVRSSLASSMAGFINGGRLGSLPVWMADSVVSIALVYTVLRQLRLP